MSHLMLGIYSSKIPQCISRRVPAFIAQTFELIPWILKSKFVSPNIKVCRGWEQHCICRLWHTSRGKLNCPSPNLYQIKFCRKYAKETLWICKFNIPSFSYLWVITKVYGTLGFVIVNISFTRPLREWDN